MTERVEIEVGASTAQAVSALNNITTASTQMAGTMVHSVTSALNPMESLALMISAVESAINLAIMAFDALSRPIRTAIDLGIEYRGEQDSLVQSLNGVDREVDRVGAAFGEVALQALESSGAVEDLQGWLHQLVNQILDADSAIGHLVREGFAALINGAFYVVEGVLRIAQGLQFLINLIPVITAGFEEIGHSSEAAFLVLTQGRVGQELLDTTHAMDELAASARMFGRDADTATMQQLQLRLADLGKEYANLGGQITTALTAEQRAQEQQQTAIENAARQTESIQNTLGFLGELRATFDRAIAGLQGDAHLPNEPPGGGGDGGRERRRRTEGRMFFDPLGLFFATPDEFQAALDAFNLRMERIQEELARTKKETPFDMVSADLIDPWQSMVETMASTFQGGLDGMLRGLGRFLATGADGFAQFGEIVKNTFASTLGSIGSAMQQAAVAGIISGASGPFGLFAALGAMFSLASGLIGGLGSGGHGRGAGGAQFADTLNTMRPEVSATGPTTVVQMSIGAIFSPEESTTAVAKLTRRAIASGELGGVIG